MSIYIYDSVALYFIVLYVYLIFLIQVVPVSKATQDVRRSRGFAVNELVFQVQAPPLGFSTYSVSLLQDGPPRTAVQHDAPTVIQNKVSTPDCYHEEYLKNKKKNLTECERCY